MLVVGPVTPIVAVEDTGPPMNSVTVYDLVYEKYELYAGGWAAVTFAS